MLSPGEPRSRLNAGDFGTVGDRVVAEVSQVKQGPVGEVAESYFALIGEACGTLISVRRARGSSANNLGVCKLLQRDPHAANVYVGAICV